ncbi:unnamed protein product [Clavelina lepadiformis]|uniref:Uncharacterized protein n=1 Tax=Clavelina lepadiformis TaxID=159417 RepID=A0ABP0GSE4_CLALP
MLDPNVGKYFQSPNVRVASGARPGRGSAATASGHAPSQTPNPAASSRDPEAVLGYHGDAGFCDYYEGAGSRVSECARECESKQNRSRLASGTMGRCNAVRADRPCLAGVLSGLSDPVASYRRASARVLHSNRRAASGIDGFRSSCKPRA